MVYINYTVTLEYLQRLERERANQSHKHLSIILEAVKYKYNAFFVFYLSLLKGPQTFFFPV